MNILHREMKANRKSLFIWSVGIILLVAACMSKYSVQSQAGESMNELMSSMPKSLQAIMGIGTLDLSTPLGYYGVLYLYLLLMGTIHAVMLGATIIAKEERDKTYEFLFVKPFSRSSIITMKLLAALINLFIFNLVTSVSSILLVGYYGDGYGGTGDVFVLMSGLFILQLLYLVIGSAIAAVIRQPKKAASLSTGLLLITYILAILVDLSENLEFLKYITPFKYYDAKNMLYGDAFEPVFVILSVGLIFILGALTFHYYQKKDLNA
ncbi:ABC transporter permease subunit [Fredinandcohnia humi]